MRPPARFSSKGFTTEPISLTGSSPPAERGVRPRRTDPEDGMTDEIGEGASDPLVGIVMGSASDKGIMQKSEVILDRFGIPYETRILSAHRMPDQAHEYGQLAEDRGLEVIIAAAGRAA